MRATLSRRDQQRLNCIRDSRRTAHKFSSRRRRAILLLNTFSRVPVIRRILNATSPPFFFISRLSKDLHSPRSAPRFGSSHPCNSLYRDSFLLFLFFLFFSFFFYTRDTDTSDLDGFTFRFVAENSKFCFAKRKVSRWLTTAYNALFFLFLVRLKF